MTSEYPPLRSVLYMPAANARALKKATTLPCDAVILDLEDAVAPSAKGTARESACAAASSADFGARTVVIRVNGLGTEWHTADLHAAAQAGPDAIAVPKVASAEQLRGLAEAVSEAGAPERTALWAMVETPAGVLRCAEIAAASPRLTVLVMGTNDLAHELRAEHVPGRAPLLTALSSCVLAARASGVAILDGVFNDVGDQIGFEAECAQARQLGFDGKTLIHPRQVEPCNALFTPDAEAVEDARAVVAAWQHAGGEGVITVHGRMIEHMHVAHARRVLALHAAATGE